MAAGIGAAGLAIAIAAGLGPSGEPPTWLDLRWRAPAGCPGRELVLARLRELTGDDVTSASTVVIDAEVTRRRDGFGLVLRTVTTAGNTAHELGSADCRALADAAALVAAVAIDPIVTEARLPAPSETAPARAPEDERPVDPPPQPITPVRERGRLRLARFILRADAMVEYGSLPTESFGPVVSVGMIGPHWRVELAGIYQGPRTAYVDREHTAGTAVALWAARARGCGVPVVRVLEFPLCVGLEGGQLRARRLGDASTTEVDARPWGALSIGPAIGVSPRPFIAIFAGIDAVVPLGRPRFYAAALAVHQPAAAAVRATIGLELRVP